MRSNENRAMQADAAGLRQRGTWRWWLLRSAALSCAAIASLPVTSFAQVEGLADLVYQSVGQVNRELQGRGYLLSNSAPSQGNSYWQYWWNAPRGQCIRVAVNDERVNQIINAGAGECRQDAAAQLPAASGGDLSNLLYQSVSYANRELPYRGYALTNAVSAQGGSYWQYWWNAARGQCIRIAINDERVTQVISTGAGECRQQAAASPPGAPSWDHSNLLYQSVSYVNRELPYRGYLLKNAVSSQGGSYWQYWWNAARGQCIRVAINDDRVTQVIDAGAGDCR